MKRALERVDEIAVYRLGRVKLDKLPPNRLAALARYGLGSKATGMTCCPSVRQPVQLVRQGCGDGTDAAV